MSTHAARKARMILANAQAVVAIEMLTAAQAADWRIGMNIAADQKRPPEQSVADANREAEKFTTVTQRWRDAIAPGLAPKLRAVYERIRERVPALVADRVLDRDVRVMREMIESGALTR